MKSRHPFFLCLLLFGFAAHGQETPIHNQTVAPALARYEIAQAQTAAKWTFRLDRFTGQVSQLVRARSGGTAWEGMRVIGILAESTNPARPHFQLFLSGLAAKHTFLIDVDSGRTWALTTLTDDKGKVIETVWKPFEE
jgi:hypothetical protein